ncbi:hypothetical protein N7495_003492 [Penicillium taxi]|uniref:uncharacterized protein n=1 Tax=Penicillium taxi TaxID=168475 RepID=UPI002544DA6B|nr:uncharacterized protein N7495_003492 [Penicillium taxi]KAJ5898748.1 hypothetical protein N7495_003492 [Penicillium taxi]
MAGNLERHISAVKVEYNTRHPAGSLISATPTKGPIIKDGGTILKNERCCKKGKSRITDLGSLQE